MLSTVVQFIILLASNWVGSMYGGTINVHVNGSDIEECLTVEVPCASLDYALSHLQSGDYVNITSAVVSLLSVVKINNVNNITMRGQGNTIVMCNSTGGVSCTNCSDVVIEGITWDQCGDPDLQGLAYPKAYGGLNFTNVTNLLINNCTLQHTRVHALSLHLVAGSININNTQFLSNANYDDIYYFQGSLYIYSDKSNVAGAVYIEDATHQASINIWNCIFSNNGYLGKVLDKEPTSKEYEKSEIADGAAIKIMQITSVVPINITVKNCVFIHNRGCSGGAVNIDVSQSLGIEFNNVSFWNNSVMQFSVNSSALFVFLRNASSTLLQLSNCDFQYNSGGRSIIGYIVAGESSDVHISTCKFQANTEYNVGLIELNIQSQSNITFENSHLAENSGTALFYAQLHASDIIASLRNLHVSNNAGSSVARRGSLLAFRLYEDNCIVNVTRLVFIMNYFVRNGGGLYIAGIFKTNFKCYVQDSHFESNIGQGEGTIVFSILQSDDPYVFTIYNSSFINNTGGSIAYIGKVALLRDPSNRAQSCLLVLGQSTSFLSNRGTPIRLTDVIIVGNGKTEFTNNVAQSGAALHLIESYAVPYVSSFQFKFSHNYAIVHGGAIFVDSSTNVYTSHCVWLLYKVAKNGSLCNNRSRDFLTAGECVWLSQVQRFCDKFPQNSNADNSQQCHLTFANNSASVAGSIIYYSVHPSTPIGNSSNPSSVFYLPEDFCINSSSGVRRLATQPYKLTLKAPATCLDNDCTSYYLSGIMLGQEIRVPAQILGYNNESAEATVFFITCVENCSNIEIIGKMPALIDSQLSAISIIGQENISITKLQLSSDTITLNLIVELTSCLPGYVYNNSTRKCECFTTDEIVSCSPSTTIKRNYWFGVVDDVTTVSVCPNGYCNFSSRKEENVSGRFLLSPIQDDQCNEHRTGPACGECDPGYTLSYDSVDCVSIDDCHYKYVIAVVVGTVTYWILVIVFLFALIGLIIKHLEYGIGIGYLYGIIYYYSVADILLGQILNFSDGLSILGSILGIFFKLNPGFDHFRFCFIQGMQRIDQSLIHYIHPTVLFLFLLLMILFTKTKYSTRIKYRPWQVTYKKDNKRKTTNTIIPIICLILTIAYTSIADTSIQLFRSIKFTGVDRTFVYLSPSIEYFTGSHIGYFIVALFYELLIVGGLPLLLILSYWHPIQVKWKCISIDMKPILDQFQGCYKDSYRWFAAVYLICRQVILIIVVINFSDYYIELYLLTFICLVTAILHHVIQPYENDVLNKSDGILLHLLLLIISLQMVFFSNGFTIRAVEGLAYVLLLLPIIFTIVMFYILIHRLPPTTDDKSESTRSAEHQRLHMQRHQLAINAVTNTNGLNLKQLGEPLLRHRSSDATTEIETM